ncbi:MAG: molybdenum cofactor biosynthesis protein MoaE [Flavobacteriales bacterium]
MKTTGQEETEKTFVQGALSAAFITKLVEKHNTRTDIGAHNIFLGRVRSDVIDGKEVKAIDYSAYEEMAENEFHKIQQEALRQFDIICLHIFHSLGIVEAGGVSLCVFVASAHREAAYKASRHILEEIKTRVPVFGREILDDETHSWKSNNDK